MTTKPSEPKCSCRTQSEIMSIAHKKDCAIWPHNQPDSPTESVAREPMEFWLVPDEQCEETGSWLGCSVSNCPPQDKLLPSTHVIEMSAYEKLKCELESVRKRLEIRNISVSKSAKDALDAIAERDALKGKLAESIAHIEKLYDYTGEFESLTAKLQVAREALEDIADLHNPNPLKYISSPTAEFMAKARDALKRIDELIKRRGGS